MTTGPLGSTLATSSGKITAVVFPPGVTMSSVLRPSASDALAEWARRVRENRQQVDRVREVEDGADFYGPVAARFVADPHRRDDPTLEVLRGLIAPGERWLDVGAGGGRYALPIALL